jgi:hypothetical protein
MQFLKENWVWILAPVVLFAAVAAFLVFSGENVEPVYYTH